MLSINYLHRSLRSFSAVVFLLAGVSLAASAQSLVMVSGNGQVAQEQFPTNMPMVVQARNAVGAPAAGVAITWTISQGQGTLVGKTDITDANGYASTKFVGTNLQPGNGFSSQTVSAGSPYGSVNFFVTTSALRTVGGGSAVLPLVELISPPLDNRVISGRSGSTLPAAVSVRVVSLAGYQTGQPVPNVGLRIVNADDPASIPVAVCTGPTGLVLTDTNGIARCDLTLGTTVGMTRIAGLIGEYQYTPAINLDITPGAACTFTLSPAAQSIPAGGGSGTVNVTAGSGCAWTSAANASWVAITSGTNGTGNGSVGFTVSPNSGVARTGTLTIGGQTFTISQAASTGGGSNALAISSGALPGGTVGTAYSTAFFATGGQQPYTWSLSGAIPPGLSLNAASGTLTGTPTAAGTYGFTASVRDAAGTSVSQSFAITVGVTPVPGGGGLTITNTSFPNGTIGQAYSQALTTSGGCTNPFSSTPGFAVASGALPAGLTVGLIASSTYGISGTPTTNGSYPFALRATDPCGNTATANFTITIGTGGGSASISVTPASLTFTMIQGSAVPAGQSLNVTSPAPVNFSAATATNWLAVTGGGTTPGLVNVGLTNTSALAAGTYQGALTVTPVGGNAVTVPVNLTVTANVTLGISPGALTFSLAPRGTGRQDLRITNSGGVQFSLAAATQAGGPWLSVTPASGNATTTATVAVDAAALTPGSYLGTVTVTPAGGTPQQVVVSLTVTQPTTLTAAPSALTFTSSAGQNPAAQALAIASGGTSANFNISVSGGNWLTVNAAAATTPASVQVSANTQGLAPGTYQGNITLSAAEGAQTPLTIPVTLTVTEAGPSLTAITNGASFQPGSVSPGEFVVIFGSKLGPKDLVTAQPSEAGLLPDTLSATRVYFDGVAAPVYYTSAGQLSAIVPYAMAGRATAKLQVEYQGLRSNTVDLLVAESAPGIFTVDPSGQAAAINEDGTINSVTNGAEPGSIVSFYATGEGQTDPSGLDGLITKDVLARPKLPVRVLIRGEEAEVLYAGSAPGSPAGILQVNARIPATAPRGSYLDVRLQVGGALSQSGVKIATRP